MLNRSIGLFNKYFQHRIVKNFRKSLITISFVIASVTQNSFSDVADLDETEMFGLGIRFVDFSLLNTVVYVVNENIKSSCKLRADIMLHNMSLVK